LKSQYWFGQWHDGELTVADAARLCRRAAELRQPVADYPLDKVLRLLDRVRQRWEDPKYGPRKAAEKSLSGITGFSPAMVRLGLKELRWTFDPELLRRKMDAELPGYEGLGARRWEPLGVVLHVLAGNVFLGAAGSLVEGLLTRNVNILKMSSSESVFLPLLIESLRECDEDGIISKSLAVVQFAQKQTDVIEEFKRKVDGIVVWGGESAVRGWRDGLPARTRLIVFGPKLSVAVVTKQGLQDRKVEDVAEDLAKEMSIWDQNACTAPQVCYVQGEDNARRLLDALPRALDNAAKLMPPGDVDVDAAVEIRKLRTVAEVAEARGEGGLRESAKRLDWTVLLDKDLTLSPSPLHRTLRLVSFDKKADVLDQLVSLRGYVQTVGLAAHQTEQEGLADLFSSAGALRVLELGRMAEGEIDDPHDGAQDLPQFMRLVLRRLPGRSDWTPAERLSPDARKALIDARLRRLIDVARKSLFYGRRLKGVRIETTADLIKIPELTRDEMEANMPPQGEGLSTGAWSGGYVSRSGGSTGAPKFSVYDRHDWEAMIANAAPVFRGLGLEPSDRLGNFMLAGDLYGSFVSFDHVNCRLGLRTFAFAGGSTAETFVEIWRKFHINAVEGITTYFMPFLRKAKELERRLTLDTVVYAGWPMSAADYDWLKSNLKVRRISSVIGANDGGQIGYQCEHMRGPLHHTIDEFNWMEVVDEEGRPLGVGETGRILITSLLKFAYPLIRYAIGDAGRIVKGTCACGRPARRFELLGRCDDLVKVGNMSVRQRDIVTALEGLPVTALQVVARNSGEGETLDIRVEAPVASSPAMQGRMRQALLRGVKNLRKRLDDGSLKELSLSLHRPGTLPRNPRTGKLRSPIDERI